MAEYVNDGATEWFYWVQGKIPEEYACVSSSKHTPGASHAIADFNLVETNLSRPPVVPSSSRLLFRLQLLAKPCVFMVHFPIAREILQLHRWNTRPSRKHPRSLLGLMQELELSKAIRILLLSWRHLVQLRLPLLPMVPLQMALPLFLQLKAPLCLLSRRTTHYLFLYLLGRNRRNQRRHLSLSILGRTNLLRAPRRSLLPVAELASDLTSREILLLRDAKDAKLRRPARRARSENHVLKIKRKVSSSRPSKSSTWKPLLF